MQRPSHLERVSSSYNKRHGSDFARKTAEKKYLAPWGLSLKEVPTKAFENEPRNFSVKEEFDFFAALHFVKYRMKKAYHQKQQERYYKIYLAMRNRGVAHNWPLVPSCVKKHLGAVPPGVDIAYLFEQGYTALIAAGDGFDPWFGYRLSTYACTAIKQSFYRHRKALRTESLDTTIDVPAPQVDDHNGWMVEQLTQVLNLNILEDRERHIIAMRFGCYGYNDHLTLEAVGKQMGICKERVRQIQHIAIDKLRTHLKLQIDSFENPES